MTNTSNLNQDTLRQDKNQVMSALTFRKLVTIQWSDDRRQRLHDCL